MNRLRDSILILVSILLTASFPAVANRRALLIGIEQYEPPGGHVSMDPAKKSTSRKALTSGDVRHWIYPNLQGPIKDVELMAALLSANDFNFEIRKLITPEETTAEAILAAFREELITNAKKDDVRLVYYSGHGNFIRNAALERKKPQPPNIFDQTIVASDQWQGGVDVRDKEISQILWESAQKGVIVTFIADSCHSGSLTRGPEDLHGRPRSNSGVRGGEEGAAFTEPLIDDDPPVDKKTGKEINPEKLGVLTLAAAQQNQEALEIWDEKAFHGAMTMALVRAIREEGPRASMQHVFDRMSYYMRAQNLVQTPILSGEGRADKDLLGQAARNEPFSVIVTDARDGEARLAGGTAIGLFAGSELRRISKDKDAPEVTLEVAGTPGLADSAAKINPPDADVHSGDRFEVTKWATPDIPNLRVYIAPPADTQVITQATQSLAPLRDDPSVHWVDDPTVDTPTDILRWSSSSWMLDHLGGQLKTTDLGAAPSIADLKKALSQGSRLFILMPPSPALSAAITLGEGTKYPGIARLRGADALNADYRLYGRIAGAGVQYAWVRSDAELGSRKPSGGGATVAAAKPGSAAQAAQTSGSSLPKRTDWFDGSGASLGDTLTQYAVRLGRVSAWLTLSGRPGQAVFPYRLVLRKTGSTQSARAGTLYGGEQYNVYLQLDPKYPSRVTTRRWVYVFGIDEKGKGKLIFPPLESGGSGNRLPLLPPNVKDADTAPALPLIKISARDYDFEVAEPYGTDTYIMVSAREAITDLNVFNFDGVQSKGSRGAGGSALEQLLSLTGDSTSRGMIVAKAPTEWSIEQLPFLSVQKK